MKCKDCNLCISYWSFGRVTSWGWKCAVLNTTVFHIEDDEAKLMGIPSPMIFERWRDYLKEDSIKMWQSILDIECIASANDVIQFIDVAQEELQNLDIKIAALLEDKQYLQDDIQDATETLKHIQK